MPVIVTAVTSPSSSSTAISGGNIISEGGSQITAKGVCWSTLANPTTSDSLTNEGGGNENFISYISGLSPATTYHLRAYAINAYGTGYGDDVSFTTSPLNIFKEESANFEIYPNPLHGWLYIKFKSGNADHLMIRVFDISGNEIIGRESVPVICDQVESINLVSLPEGVYIIRLTTDRTDEIRRIILQK